MPVTHSSKPKQYFLAIVPPSPVFEEALNLKHYFKEHYNTKASLNSPPHITLHMPFRWKEEKEHELEEKLRSFKAGVSAFTMQLRNFGSFPPRVIFIDVAPSPDLIALQNKLMKFCKLELNIFNADYKDQPFHPHLTLAFRDLKKSIYAEAWKEFSEKLYTAEFEVTSFAILKHNGRTWEVLTNIPLNPDVDKH